MEGMVRHRPLVVDAVEALQSLSDDQEGNQGWWVSRTKGLNRQLRPRL
jgi:hypothetical protein